MTVELYRETIMRARGTLTAGRTIFGTTRGQQSRPVFMEWELTAAQWVDQHPHDEFNFILEGVLHVESDGQTVVAQTGDLVRVLAHSEGRYFAPVHARMLAVYDHNPEGLPSMIAGSSSLPPTEDQ